jgi:hypothetical protein
MLLLAFYVSNPEDGDPMFPERYKNKETAQQKYYSVGR